MASPSSRPSPETLLRHSGFLAGLARELVRDEHEAQDLVQETWAAALSRPPEEAGSLRGWLAIVMANRMRNRRRGASRRGQRETIAARPEHVEPGEGSLERLETQRALIDLLLELPEAQRVVLYLRYYEERTPTEIARHLGVPVKTVKTRHTRGIAALREALDRRSGGDRREWVSALVPLLEVHAATATVSSGGLLLPAVAVTTLVVALVAMGAWWRGQPSGGERVAAAPAVVATPAPARVGRVLEEARHELTSPAVPGAAPSCVLEGDVRLRETGAAVAGLTVRALRAGENPAETTTDDEGRYRFEWPSPVDVYRLEADAGRTTTAASRESIGRVGAEPVRVDLIVSGGARLEGVVVDWDGAPVAGARVRGWCREEYDPALPPDRATTADSDGRFVIEHLGEAFTLDALAEGLACRHGLRGQLEPGSVARGLEVRMTSAVTFEGRVVDDTGAGVSDVRLQIDHGDEWSDADLTAVPGVQRMTAVRLATRSDVTGAFSLGPLPRQPWSPRVTADGFLEQFAELVPDEPAWIVLDRGCWLTGTVSDASGSPVVGADVRVDAASQASAGFARTDANGRFRVGALAESENAFVLVEAAGFALHARQPVVLSRGGGHVDLSLEPERELAGRVLDEEGNPLRDVPVRIEGDRQVVYEDVNHGEPTTWEWCAGIHRTRTDEQGRFRFGQLHEGAFRVEAQPVSGKRVAVTARAGDESVEIVAGTPQPGAILSGRVVDGSTGEPLDEFTVLPMRFDPDRGSSSGSGVRIGPAAGGRYRLTGYEPGIYTLVYSAPGFADQRLAPREITGEARIDVRLFPARSIQLRVVDQEGNPVEARVRVFDPDGTQRMMQVGGMSISDVRSRNGLLGLTGLPAGPVRLWVQGEALEEVEVEIDLTHPFTEPVEVVLEGEGQEHVPWSLAVLVTDEPELAGLHSLEDLRAAYEAGRVRMPRETITIDFQNAADRSLQTTTIEFLEAFRYHVRTEGARPFGGWSEEGEFQGPESRGSIPATVTRAIVTLAGQEPVEVAPDPEADADEGRVLVLLDPR